jgi:hypothetical protein
VQVFADSPARDVLCDALGRGALYASTGAELRSIDVDETRYTVVPVDADARVVFVGDHGRILSSVDGGAAARYVVRGGEGYVRARVETRHGDAWTPAVRVGGG